MEQSNKQVHNNATAVTNNDGNGYKDCMLNDGVYV